MKKIIIFGAKGMLGQELVRVFSDKNYEVKGIDKDNLDLIDVDALNHFFVQEKPDIVINAAAYNAVDLIEEDDEAFDIAQKINVNVPGELARLCKKHDVLFVHYSSDYVFDGENKDGYDEDVMPHPLSRYGYTKLKSEHIVQQNGDRYYIIRLSRLFGKPAMSEGAKKSFVDVMIWLATEGGKTELDIVDEEVSCPTYAPDLALFTKNLIEDNPESGIYHGANDGACTWYEFATEIFTLKNIDITLNAVNADTFPRPAKRPAYSELLNTKREKMRGWGEALGEYLST